VTLDLGAARRCRRAWAGSPGEASKQTPGTHTVSVECPTFRTLLIALYRHDANTPPQNRTELGIAELLDVAAIIVMVLDRLDRLALEAIGDLLEPAVARQFIADLQAYYAEDDAVKRDEIANRQLRALRQFQRPREERFRLADVKRLFELMKDHA
jgi:hypothetical protein